MTINRKPNSEDVMHRRKFLGWSASLGLTLAAPPLVARAAARELLVAEPVHSTGYLPMYIAMANGYFAESDITVKIVTIETGSGHTNAVLSGQAFAFIGGPEHNAFAKAKGAELRAVVHCVDRGNVYICAAKGQEPRDTNWPAYFKGKSIALGPFGGTPNSITRYLLGKWKLDAKRDVTLHEMPNSAVPAGVRGGQATIGVSTEPMIMQGIRIGLWGEPFFNVPKELGPYAYSTINVRLDSIQKEPAVVRGFVRGMIKGLKSIYAKPAEAADIAKKQFPTMPLDDLKATLDRSYRDEMWSRDGMISRPAWDTASAVVREAGILKSDVKYDEIMDMSLVESIRATL
jgi:NitT/TauT family transport system substrate-binding protein